MSKRVVLILVLGVMASIGATVFALWHYNHTMAMADEKAILESEALMGAYAMADVLERESKKGRTNWDLTLADVIGSYPEVSQAWGPLKYYDWRDFSPASIRFDANGKFIGEVKVSVSGSRAAKLPSWLIDLARNPMVGSSEGMLQVN